MKNYVEEIELAAESLHGYGHRDHMKLVLRDLILDALYEGSSMEYRMNKGRTADDIVKEALDGL